jgi:imidazolonepropionase-like amidohydrolase/Tol biopolymer transport system component
MRSIYSSTFKISIFFILTLFSITWSQEDSKKLPLKSDRNFQLKTSEATWIPLDVSPDGKQIAFAVLGDLYTLPIEGGKATRVTKGLAFDTHPRYSPDGKSIAFCSDRDGSDNVWVINFEKKDTTQITKESADIIASVEWTPDGDYLIIAKGSRINKLYMYHKDGGGGTQLISEPSSLNTKEPAFGADKNIIWFSQRYGSWNYNAQLPQYQLATYNRKTSKIETKTNQYGSAFCPTLSPDGKWLVYGTRYNDQTGLMKRNLITGEESWLAYPVQRDEQESIAPLGVYPPMSFTPDSKHLIAFYGGKINSIPVEGGDAKLIPFEIDETVDLGPEVKFNYPIKDDVEMVATQIRDAAISPDGKMLAFTSLNRLYVMEYPLGTPRRLTNANYTEAFPTWSADNSTIAYVTWDEKEGNIYKVGVAANSQPIKLTSTPGIFTDLKWDHKTNRLIFLKGFAQAYQDAIHPWALGTNEFLSWIPADGGEITNICAGGEYSHPHFTEEADRIFAFHYEKGLVSFRWDGTDEKELLQVTGITAFGWILPEDHHHAVDCLLMNTVEEPRAKPSKPSVIEMAPKGDKALVQINNDIYVVTVPYIGSKAINISVADVNSSAFPSWKLTFIGGEFPQWNSQGTQVHWSLGNAHFTYDLAESKLVTDSIEKATKEKEKLKDKDKKKKEEDKEKTDDKKYKAKEVRIKVTVKKDIPQGSLLLQHARIISMKGDEIIENGDILIQNARIIGIGPTGTLKPPADAKVMDMTGKTITPGFIDTHAHMWPNWGLHKSQVWPYAANLAYGVTTTRDPQTATTDVLTYSDMVETGQILGPRIYSTGPGIGFWGYKLESLEHTRNVLKQYSDYYNTKTIKMYLTGNRKHRQWIVQACKEQKLMPTTEGGLDFKLNLSQVLDGYPGHEHAFPIYPIYDDVKQLMVKVRTNYTPTLLVSYGGPWAENYFYATEDVQGNKKLNYFTPKDELDAKSRRRTSWFLKEEHIFSRHAEFVNDLVKAGGLVGVGSHGQLQGMGYHWELWAMQSGGISTHNALKTATILGATALGLEKDLGSLEVGKLADLVIMESNPLDNIRNTNTILYVMRNGRLYDANSLSEIYPEQKTAPVFYWQEKTPEFLPGIKK